VLQTKFNHFNDFFKTIEVENIETKITVHLVSLQNNLCDLAVI